GGGGGRALPWGTFSPPGKGCEHVVDGRRRLRIRDAGRRDVDAAADSLAGAAALDRGAARGAIVNDPAGLHLEARRSAGGGPAVKHTAAQAVAAQEADGLDAHNRTMADVPVREGGPQTVPLAVAALAVATFRRGDDSAEEAICFGVKPRCEVEGVGKAAVAAVAEGQIPQALRTREERVAVLVGEGALVRPAHRVVGVDLAGYIAEVADEQIAAKPAEGGRGQGDPPGRGQLAAGGHLLDEIAAGIESRHGPD